MSAFIQPPKKIPLYLRIGIWIARKITEKEMLPAQLLAWYPRSAVASGILEALAAHKDGNVDERLLKLLRMAVSFQVSCPFCIDMNSYQYENYRISHEELLALQGLKDLDTIPSFSLRESLVIRYAQFASKSPLNFPAETIKSLKQNFSERELVLLATTIAQVNYWARLIQALGIPPAGYSTPEEMNIYLPPRQGT